MNEIKAVVNELVDQLEDKAKKMYPIGKIEINTTGDNPVLYLGFGTWEEWGKGRVPVGVNSDDEEFNEAEKEGGEKNHLLTIGEIPSHSHQQHIYTNNTGSSTIQTPGHYFNDNVLQYSGNKGMHLAAMGDTGLKGEEQPHNNLQPYITCYMYKRTK